MEFYLQFGYGMMDLSTELLGNWESGVVILSPRDLKYEQILKFSSKLNGGRVVIDPQFYVPKSDHERLTSHSYWPADYQTSWLSKDGISKMLLTLKDEYNDKLNSLFFILPGMKSSEITEDWVKINELVVNSALELQVHPNIYATVCLSKELMKSEAQIHLLLEYIESWDVQGIYLVAEPPSNTYLVDDPVWLVNLMDLVAGIKQQQKKVVIGYANQQLLVLALSKADAIASGNYLNVRSFNVAKFSAPEESTSRRSTWYYCPQALSEYQIAFLDIANRLGILNHLRTPVDFNSSYGDILFSGAQPSVTNYNEGSSFRHYLQCMKVQTENAVKHSYDETKAGLRLQLETASQLTEFFRSKGIRGKDRDFLNVVDINIAAIDIFDQLRGVIQKQKWNLL